MKDKTEQKNERKPKKKESRVSRVYRLYKSGLKPKQIAAKMKLSERVVRSYIWRAANPDKYKALLQRYFERKRQKKENEAIKLAVKNSKKTKRKKKEADVAGAE